MRNELRDAVVTEVRSRTFDACVRQAAASGGMPLDVLINDTLYHEKKRLEADSDQPGWSSDVAFWDEIKRKLSRANDAELRVLLDRIVERFASEILGNFNPRVYRAATRMLPNAMSLLLNAMSPIRMLKRGGVPPISEAIHIQGHVDALRRVHEQGTVILTPTHVSNMDSIVVGWALYEMGLPPFTYGAGLNLFTNPMISFFMNNLGAYRVDRRKTAPLYKDILKEYATVSLERGVDNLFFPGGTRIRSGHVEDKLKLGLLSSGLRAYINNLAAQRPKPSIYVVPTSLNYHLVLEAETLIAEHLKSVGKARYIITDDEFSRPRQVLHFLRQLVNLDSGLTFTVGEPLDVFGNRVDDSGQSLDPRGRIIDVEKYVMRDGRPQHVPQRDRVYVRQCGEAIARQFQTNNVALSTNVTAFCAFRMLRAKSPQTDLYRFLRTGADGAGLEMGRLAERVRRVCDALGALEKRGEVRRSELVATGDPNAVIADALRHFGSYHNHPVLLRRGDRVFSEDMSLLLYYHNRLEGYGLESAALGGESEAA